MSNIAVIFAGGVGTRMHSKDRPKQFLNMHGKPIIIHTLENFENHNEIDCIVIACIESWIPYLDQLVKDYQLKKVKCIVPGGKNGQMSIYNALCAAEKISESVLDIVLIHDGVRPIISADLITRNIESVKRFGSAITTAPVHETIIFEDVNASNKVLDRTKLLYARAPQSFYLEQIITLHRKAQKEGLTDFIDSCSLMQHYNKELYFVEGSVNNIKITTPMDFYVYRAILDSEENEQLYI